jgi:dGTPase
MAAFFETIQEYLRKRDEMLAPFAQKNSESRGREFPEEEHPMRSPFQRDRDRLVHCRSFRRLEYKTQVFVNHEGDHFRTRLTHTIEVSMISRTIAKALCLNEDLAEAVALAHDVGHPPFGHSGEAVLNGLMKEEGGFEHNLQSLRIVEKLEKRYPTFEGLNLSWEVREGIIKHRSDFDSPALMKKYDVSQSPSLEAQVVDFSDEIAYTSHDLDDGLSSGLIVEEQLMDVPIWSEVRNKAGKEFPSAEGEVRKFFIIRNIIDYLVSDLITQSYKNIIASGVRSAQAVKQQPRPLVSFSEKIEKGNKLLKDFLMQNLYCHKKVLDVNKKAGVVLKDIFTYYLEHQEKLEKSTRMKLKERSLKRVICDYVAGMTDRYAIFLHEKIFPEKKDTLFKKYL